MPGGNGAGSEIEAHREFLMLRLIIWLKKNQSLIQSFEASFVEPNDPASSPDAGSVNGFVARFVNAEEFQEFKSVSEQSLANLSLTCHLKGVQPKELEFALPQNFSEDDSEYFQAEVLKIVTFAGFLDATLDNILKYINLVENNVETHLHINSIKGFLEQIFYILLNFNSLLVCNKTIVSESSELKLQPNILNQHLAEKIRLEISGFADFVEHVIDDKYFPICSRLDELLKQTEAKKGIKIFRNSKKSLKPYNDVPLCDSVKEMLRLAHGFLYLRLSVVRPDALEQVQAILLPSNSDAICSINTYQGLFESYVNMLNLLEIEHAHVDIALSLLLFLRASWIGFVSQNKIDDTRGVFAISVILARLNQLIAAIYTKIPILINHLPPNKCLSLSLLITSDSSCLPTRQDQSLRTEADEFFLSQQKARIRVLPPACFQLMTPSPSPQRMPRRLSGDFTSAAQDKSCWRRFLVCCGCAGGESDDETQYNAIN